MQEIGRILKEKRIERGLEIGDVARKTCIRDYYLRAMEDGRFHTIPRAYYKGYVRIYATLLNIDAKMLLASYEQRQRGAGPQQQSIQVDAPPASAQPVAQPSAANRQESRT